MAGTEKNNLREQVAMLPQSPGVYQFVDRSGTIIYVGKAKSLRKRVSSYFVQSKEHSPKVRVLVKQIAEIRHIVVDSETDALLLENSLIKTLQPRYNILLKDDKTYPWIVVRREHFPRVQSTRQLNRDGSQYFGPYGSVVMQHSVLDFIREVVPLRTCKLNLAPEQIAKGKYTVCLQYHLGNCKGPCIGAQGEGEYGRLVDMVVAVLKGDLRPVRSYLEQEMQRAAGELKFELAQRYKQRLDALDNYAGKSVIVSAKIVDVDVFSLLPDDDVAYCNFVRIRHGSVVGVYTVKLKTGVGGDERDMLTLAIQHVVEHIAGTLAREVIVPFLPSTTLLFDGVTFTVPKRGEKLELLEFSQKSARIYRAEQLKNLEIKNPERYTERLMTAMVSVFALSLMFGLNHEQYVTLLPKSITTAIGMGISEKMGGIVTITVVVIIVTGILGNILADTICRLCKIEDPIAKGLAIGTSAHALGTAKAMELGEIEGAMSSLSIVVCGILTVISVSIFANFI